MRAHLAVLSRRLGKRNLYVPAFADAGAVEEFNADVATAPNARPFFGNSTDYAAGVTVVLNARPFFPDPDDYAADVATAPNSAPFFSDADDYRSA